MKLQHRSYEPDFEYLLKVLRKEPVDRPVLFEYFMNDEVYSAFSGESNFVSSGPEYYRAIIDAHYNLGYDYALVPTWLHPGTFTFPSKEVRYEKSFSLNEGFVITDEDSFHAYEWPDPAAADYSLYDMVRPFLSEGFRLVGTSNDGILEALVRLVGFENLCFMVLENEELVGRIFHEIGSRTVQYFKILCQIDEIGAFIYGDDWGFGAQTMLPPEIYRKYLFPWVRQIVDTCHEADKPIILHSCGKLDEVMDEVIDTMRFDAKHSFEDKITPVEEAYVKWGDRISIIGGIDINFLCMSTPEKIEKRTLDLWSLTKNRNYAFGSGNSIPPYVPLDHYLAMVEAVFPDLSRIV